jgi:hypothetical protein
MRSLSASHDGLDPPTVSPDFQAENMIEDHSARSTKCTEEPTIDDMSIHRSISWKTSTSSPSKDEHGNDCYRSSDGRVEITIVSQPEEDPAALYPNPSLSSLEEFILARKVNMIGKADSGKQSALQSDLEESKLGPVKSSLPDTPCARPDARDNGPPARDTVQVPTTERENRGPLSLLEYFSRTRAKHARPPLPSDEEIVSDDGSFTKFIKSRLPSYSYSMTDASISASTATSDDGTFARFVKARAAAQEPLEVPATLSDRPNLSMITDASPAQLPRHGSSCATERTQATQTSRSQSKETAVGEALQLTFQPGQSALKSSVTNMVFCPVDALSMTSSTSVSLLSDVIIHTVYEDTSLPEIREDPSSYGNGSVNSPLSTDQGDGVKTSPEVSVNNTPNASATKRGQHFRWFGHGVVWTLIAISFAWMGTAFAVRSRNTTSFVSLSYPLSIDPMYYPVEKIGLLRLRVCYNSTFVDFEQAAENADLDRSDAVDMDNLHGCDVLELESETVDDDKIVFTRIFATFGAGGGTILSLITSASIGWDTINLRPLGFGFLVLYFFQSFCMFVYDSDLCREHKCRVDSGCICCILASVCWLVACLACARMDSFRLIRIRTERKRERRAARAAMAKDQTSPIETLARESSATTEHSSDDMAASDSTDDQQLCDDEKCPPENQEHSHPGPDVALFDDEGNPLYSC